MKMWTRNCRARREGESECRDAGVDVGQSKEITQAQLAAVRFRPSADGAAGRGAWSQ